AGVSLGAARVRGGLRGAVRGDGARPAGACGGSAGVAGGGICAELDGRRRQDSSFVIRGLKPRLGAMCPLKGALRAEPALQGGILTPAPTPRSDAAPADCSARWPATPRSTVAPASPLARSFSSSASYSGLP